MKTNSEIMSKSHETYKEHHWLIMGTALIIIIILNVSLFIPIIGILVYFAIAGPMRLGYNIFNLKLSKINTAESGDIFRGFDNFLPALGLFLLSSLIILTGLVFLVVPGIILALIFSQAFYILAENPKVGVIESLEKSSQIMKGNKWKLVGLTFRFMLLMLGTYIVLAVFFYLWPIYLN